MYLKGHVIDNHVSIRSKEASTSYSKENPKIP